MEEYKISLGAEISQQGLGNVKDQIKTLESNPIKLTLDKNLSNEIKAIKEQIDSLGSSKGKNKNALAINTESVEKSLNDIAVTIKEVRDALGTIDNKSGMKSLLSSINQITSSLGKASDETQTLVNSLSALSKKDFSFNIGIDLNNKKSTLAYGREARQSVLPELKSQINYLNDLFDKELQGITRSKKINIDQSKVGLLGKVNKIKMDYTVAGGSSSSMIGSLEAQEKYINQMVELAKASDINLDGFYSQHSKSASQLVNELTGVSQATEVVEEQTQKLKNIFGGGIDSESLTQILTDLKEINASIKTLASDTSLGGLTKSFEGLSQTLENVAKNMKIVQQVVNTTSGSVDKIKNVSGTNSDSFVDKEVLNMMKELGVAGGKGSEAFREIKSAMLEYISVAERAGNETGEVVNELAMLERSNAMSKVRDTALNYGATQSKKKELKEQQKLYKDFYADIRKTNKNGTKIFIPADVQAELPKNITRSLGSAFITKDRAGSMELDSWLKDLSERFPYVVDRTKDLAGQLMDVFQKLEIAKGRFSDASVDGAFSDNEIRNAENVIENAANNIVNSQQRIQDASSASADSIEQDENRKQQAYQETLEKLKRVNDEINNSEHKKKLDEIDEQFESLYDVDSGFTKDEADAAKQPLIDSYWSGQEDELARYNALLEERARLENELKRIDSLTTSSGSSEATSGIKEFEIAVENSEDAITGLKRALELVGLNQGNIDAVTKEFEELGITVKNITTRLNDDGSISISVKGIDKLDDAERAVKAIKNIGSDGIATGFRVEVSEDFKEVDRNFEKLKSKAQEISKLKIEIAGLDTTKNANEIDVLTSKLNRLESEYNDLHSATAKDLNENQVKELGQIAENTATKVKDLREQLSGKQADTSAIDKQKQAYKELKSIVSEIGRLEVKIAGLDVDKNANEVELLSGKLEELKAKYNSLKAEFSGQLSYNQFDNLQAELDETEFKISQVEAKLKDININRAKGIESKVSPSGAYTQQVKKLETDFKNLTVRTHESEVAVNNLREALTAMQNASSADERIEAETRYLKVLQDTEVQLKENKQANDNAYKSASFDLDIQNSQQRLNKLFEEGSQAAKKFGDEAERLRTALKSCDNDASLKNLNKEITILGNNVKQSGLNTKTFATTLRDQFRKFGAYFSVAELFMYVEQGLRDMFEQVKLIDSAMTELKKVTDETDATYSRFLKNAGERAKVIGTTIDGLVNSTADFARLGYGFEDAQGLAEVANIYAVVGDEVEGVEGATTSLISTMAAFRHEMNGLSNTDFSLSIVDKLNEVDRLAS